MRKTYQHSSGSQPRRFRRGRQSERIQHKVMVVVYEVFLPQKPCIYRVIQRIINTLRLPYLRQILNRLLHHRVHLCGRSLGAIQITPSVRVHALQHIAIADGLPPLLRQALHSLARRLIGPIPPVTRMRRPGSLAVSISLLKVPRSRGEPGVPPHRLQQGGRPEGTLRLRRLRRIKQAADLGAGPLSLRVELGATEQAQDVRMGIGLLATQLLQNALELSLVVGLVVGRRPVVQAVSVGHAIAIGLGSGLGALVVIVEAAEAVHHPAQAVGAVAVLELAAFALEGAQAVARSLEAGLVAVQVGVVVAEMHADLGEGLGVLVEVGAQGAQLRVQVEIAVAVAVVVVILVVILVVIVVVIVVWVCVCVCVVVLGGGEGGGEVVDVLGDGAVQRVVERLRDVRSGVLAQAGKVRPRRRYLEHAWLHSMDNGTLTWGSAGGLG